MIRRRIALAYWIFSLAFFIPSAVYAYIDPATTTYIIQIITALVVTLGVSLSVFLYRFRMISAKLRYGLYSLLYRKQPENKQQTEREYRFPPYTLPSAPLPPTVEDIAALSHPPANDTDGTPKPFALQKIGAKTQTHVLSTQRYTGRLRTSAPLAIAIAFSFIFIGCLDLAVQNTGDMPFQPTLLIPTLLLASLTASVLLLFILPLFRGKLYSVLVSLGMAILIAGYIQGNYMNGALGELNGERIDWTRFAAQSTASIVLWLAVLVLVFALPRFVCGVWRRLLFFLPLLLLAIQGIALASVLEDGGKSGQASIWTQTGVTLTIEGLHNPAYEKNAIIFVLDRLDDDFCDMIEENHPGFFEELDGFTRFDDNISWFSGTFPAVTGMLTGNRYLYDRSQHDYFKAAWQDADVLKEMKVRGVDIRLYTNRGYAFDDAEQVKGLASNVFEGGYDIRKRVALVKLLKLSAFRYAPMPAKPVFWLAPGEFNDTLALSDATAAYLTNDFAFYENITTFGLTPSDQAYGFFFYHLQGAHGPLNMDENIEWTEEPPESDYTVGRVSQATGCFKIVYEYLRQLKALGLYDDATILITGDHGDYRGETLEKPMHTALFVKPSGSSKEPLAYSHAPVSPSQFLPTIFEGLFGEKDPRFPAGYLDIREGDSAIRELDVNLERYKITGDGRDFANWTHIGQFSPQQPMTHF